MPKNQVAIITVGQAVNFVDLCNLILRGLVLQANIAAA